MSKAFTREDDESSEVTRRPLSAHSGPRYLTPEGWADSQRRLSELQNTERPALLADLSLDAKARLADVDARIAQLLDLLGSATVLQTDPAPSVVAFGTRVTVESEDGARRTLRLVGADEADPRNGAVSVHSPLGRALLGRRQGDTVTVERPRDAEDLVVVSISS